MVTGLLRRDENRGRSGQYLVGAGLTVLVVGLLSDLLAVRVGPPGLRLSVLELGLVALGVALGRAFVRAVKRRIRRRLLKGVLGAASLGVGLPALGVALPSLPLVGRLAKRLPLRRVATRLPMLGDSRVERLARMVGGRRGVGTGGVGATLFAYGARTGTLDQQYTVFGGQLPLGTVFLLLALSGTAVYAARNA